MRTQQMAAMFPLTDKQIKKVRRYFKNDIQYRRENFEFEGPKPGMGGPGRFPGGGPGGPGGSGGMRPDGPRPGGGAPGGAPGGMRPGGGAPGGRPDGMRPGGGRPAFMPDVDYEELEKYNAKQDKKLRRIIGDEYFAKWRAAHPRELPPL